MQTGKQLTSISDEIQTLIAEVLKEKKVGNLRDALFILNDAKHQIIKWYCKNGETLGQEKKGHALMKALDLDMKMQKVSWQMIGKESL